MKVYPKLLGRKGFEEKLSYRGVVGLSDSLGTLMEMKGFIEDDDNWNNNNPRCVSVWDNKIHLFRNFIKKSDLTQEERHCKYKWEFVFGTHNYDKYLKDANAVDSVQKEKLE